MKLLVSILLLASTQIIAQTQDVNIKFENQSTHAQRLYFFFENPASSDNFVILWRSLEIPKGTTKTLHIEDHYELKIAQGKAINDIGVQKLVHIGKKYKSTEEAQNFKIIDFGEATNASNIQLENDILQKGSLYAHLLNDRRIIMSKRILAAGQRVNFVPNTRLYILSTDNYHTEGSQINFTQIAHQAQIFNYAGQTQAHFLLQEDDAGKLQITPQK